MTPGESARSLSISMRDGRTDKATVKIDGMSVWDVTAFRVELDAASWDKPECALERTYCAPEGLMTAVQRRKIKSLNITIEYEPED